MSKSELRKKINIVGLPNVRWHQWSVVRLAAIAMITVLAGYLTAAILAVKSIDYLLRISHDPAIEAAITLSMESQKQLFKAKQDLIVERLKQRISLPKSVSEKGLRQHLAELEAHSFFTGSNWSLSELSPKSQNTIHWENRSDLVVGRFRIHFTDTREEEAYRRTEDVLKRYKIIGFELSARIRPALIRALSLTLAIMCVLLLIAFAYMTIRSKTRIERLVNGFIRYAHGDESFRFMVHGHNELGLLSRQFNTMADELAENRARTVNLEKLASWQTIARKMAHEIKNPLTPIQIMIGQLHRNYEGTDDAYGKLIEKAHHVILEEVAGLRRMVDDFSQFAQLPSPRFSKTNATACAQQTVQLAEFTYRPHSVKYEGPSEDVFAEFDDQLIRQALHNLIKNAAEASPLESYPIILRLQHSPNSLIFEVEDHGPGIPDAIRNHIFEAYVTTKHTGPNPGMGLGLAICQKIVLEHAGKLALETSPGKTIFRMILPRTRKGRTGEE